jgi:putative transcriptional regulator
MRKAKRFGEMLIGALGEAAAHARGELKAPVDRIEYTARKASVSPPPQYSAQQIRALRKNLGLSQPVFAGVLNVSGSTVRAWEQGQRQPEGPTLRLLEIAERHPEALLSNMTSMETSGG